VIPGTKAYQTHVHEANSVPFLWRHFKVQLQTGEKSHKRSSNRGSYFAFFIISHFLYIFLFIYTWKNVCNCESKLWNYAISGYHSNELSSVERKICYVVGHERANSLFFLTRNDFSEIIYAITSRIAVLIFTVDFSGPHLTKF
jgi:hypothetical protein